jgi:acyl-CoA synthetase (AMP-forming)/AMP-acid ligase II
MDVTDPGPPFDPARIGRPYPGVDLGLVEESGGAGRLTLQSDMVMAGYWNRPVATARAFTEHGALLTPDCVCVDRDGTLRLLGRVDDVINCGGQKVSPVEIEEVLAAHPAVREVVALGAPDPDGVLGEVVQAVIVVRQGAPMFGADLRAFAAARLEPHKVPRLIDFVDEIPRGLLGKAERARLRGPS